MAQFQTFFKDFPEFVDIAARRECHIHQIDGDNTLIEPSVVFWFSVFIDIRSQEAAATHAGVAIAVAVFVDFEFQHLLFGDIVRNHPFGGAFCRQFGQVVIGGIGMDVFLFQYIDQLWKSGGNPDAILIFNTLVPLTDGFPR